MVSKRFNERGLGHWRCPQQGRGGRAKDSRKEDEPPEDSEIREQRNKSNLGVITKAR